MRNGTRDPSDTGQLLILVGKEFAVLSEDIARLGGVTATQWVVMHHIGAAGRAGCSPSQIAALLRTSRPNVTKIIRRLEQTGHIQCRPRPEDRRWKHLWLTPRGDKALRRMNREKDTRLSQILAPLTEYEVNDLDRLARRLLEALSVPK